MDDAAAAQMLADANTGIPPADAPQAPPAPAPTPEVTPADSATLEDTFAQRFDPNTLPEELKARYTEMLGDYTRKTQEAAPYRKIAEEFGVSADEARQALSFVQGLNDPTTAQQYYEWMGQQLAATQPQDPLANLDSARFTDPDTGEVDPMALELERLRVQNEQVVEWMQQQQASQQEQAMQAEWQRQEMAIRQSNPAYNDADINSIYDLALATGGNLMAAQTNYSALQQRLVESFIASKQAAAATPATQPVPQGGHAEQQQGFGTDLNAAHQSALEAFRNAIAAG